MRFIFKTIYATLLVFFVAFLASHAVLAAEQKAAAPASKKSSAGSASKNGSSDVLSPMETAPPEDLKTKDDLAQKALKQAAASNTNGREISEDELVTVPEEGEQLDMAQTVQKSLAVNPRIASAQAQLEGAEAGRNAAMANFFPTLNASYTATRFDHKKPYVDAPLSQLMDNKNFSGSLTVTQPVFTGLRLLNSYLKSKLSKEKSEADKDYAELTLVLLVQQNFLTLLKARELVRSSKDSVTRLRSQLKVTQAFYDVGLKPRFDVLQAEVDLSKAEVQLVQYKNQVEIQKARLNTLLVAPLDQKINYVGELTYLPFKISLEDCIQNAFAFRPDLKAVHKAVEMAEKDVGIAKSSFYPQVNANYSTSRSGNSPLIDGSPSYEFGNPGRTEFAQWSVGLGASWKVFDFGSTYYTMRQAQAGVRQYLAEEEKAREEVMYEVKTRSLNINEAAKRIRVSKKAVEQAKEGYRMAVARYQAQVGTNTDVLDAQAKLTDAESSLTSALGDYQIAVAQMYASMGQKNYSLLAN